MRWTRRRGRLRYGRKRGQFGVLRAAKENATAPIVVLVHGGSWAPPFNRWVMWLLVRDIAARGWTSFNVEYRRLGRWGGHGGWPATFDDVRDAVRRIDEWRGDLPATVTELPPIVVVGHSAGGHLALWAAPQVGSSVIGTISLAGPTHLEPIAANGSEPVRALTAAAPAEERWQLTSPIEMLPTGVRTRCIHGADDQTVSPRQSTLYVEAAREAGDDAAAVVIDGEGHRDPLRPESGVWRSTVQMIEAWFAEHRQH